MAHLSDYPVKESTQIRIDYWWKSTRTQKSLLFPALIPLSVMHSFLVTTDQFSDEGDKIMTDLMHTSFSVIIDKQFFFQFQEN